MKTLSTLCLAISILVLTACSHLRVEKTDPQDSLLAQDSQSSKSTSAKIPAQLAQWQLSGKLGVRSNKTATSANLQWQQNQQDYAIKLSGPLGAGMVTAEGNQQIIEVKQGSKTYRGNPQMIGDQLLGIPVPVHAISWWARGLPSPDLNPPIDLSTDAQGKIKRFTQSGWQLSYSRYEIAQGYLLPTKLSGQLGDLSFKLIVSDWITADD